MYSDTEILQLVRVKGRATAEAVGLVTGADGAVVLAPLLADGLVEDGRFGVKLTDAGRAVAAQAFARDAAKMHDRGDALYASFCESNAPFKQLVTDWQLKTLDDAGALANLTQLHAVVTPVLDEFALHIPRLTSYRARLDTALAAVETGQSEFIASPAVDSYHTVWFELHEDLILCTGRTRADEAHAGRA